MLSCNGFCWEPTDHKVEKRSWKPNDKWLDVVKEMKVAVIPIAVDDFWTVSNNLEKRFVQLEVRRKT